jgi:hypothetical protein
VSTLLSQHGFHVLVLDKTGLAGDSSLLGGDDQISLIHTIRDWGNPAHELDDCTVGVAKIEGTLISAIYRSFVADSVGI